MTVYQIADGHDNAAGLATISPQPGVPDAVKFPETDFFGDGGAEVNGFQQLELVWTALTRSQYNTLRTALGVTDTVITNDVTIRIRTNADTFANYNATVIDLQTARRSYTGWENYRVLVTKLEAI